MPRTRYDALTLSLHWLIALLIAAIYALGYGRELMPKGDLRTGFMMLHMSLGLACVMLVGVRISWRLAAPPPAPIETSRTAHLAARATHLVLYALMILAPVTGLAASWIKGRAVGFFGLPLPSPFMVDVPFGKVLENVHEFAANGMLALIGLHVAAALGHHYILGDGMLRRMLPLRAS